METRIAALRREHNWTQRDLARISGVGRSTIEAIEAGKTTPTLETAHKLAKSLGASIEYTMGWSVIREVLQGKVVKENQMLRKALVEARTRNQDTNELIREALMRGIPEGQGKYK